MMNDKPTDKKPLLENSPATKNLVKPAPEAGGPKGPEPTRYGDWERNGKCVDF